MSEEENAGGNEQGSGGVGAGRDVTAGRDIAGGDIVTSTTQVGFSERAVLRLVIVVGVLVFITAACFFSGGIAVGAGAFAAINQEVNSSLPVAQSVQITLQKIEALPEGQNFRVEFTERQLSSYFKFILAPELGIEDGKLRVISADQIAIAGSTDILGQRRFVATFSINPESAEPLQLQNAAVQVVDAGPSSFGWVAVPTLLLGPVEDRINQRLVGNFQITAVSELLGAERGLEIHGIAGSR